MDKPSLLNGFVLGIAAILASWVLSGCRFGNRSSNPIDKNPTGYYLTAPSTLKFSTNVRDGSFASDIGQIPDDAALIMTNPLIFQIEDYDLESGISIIANKTGTTGYQVFYSQDPDKPKSGSIQSILSKDLGQYWTDPACTSLLSITIDGELNQFDQSQIGPGGLFVSGRLKSKFTVIEELQGNCSQTMNSVESCYQDFNQCAGTTEANNVAIQNNVKNIFERYIHSGAITSSEIKNVRSYSFEAEYE